MTFSMTFDAAYAAALFEELRSKTSDPPGVTRAAFGEGEQIAHAMVRREAASLGLTERIDHAGNLYLTLEGSNPELPGWIVGSHLDSVPHGGNFDGAAGVIGGLCAVRGLVQAGIRPERSITVMAIRAEESNWFPLSYLGSRAAFGLLESSGLEVPRSDTGRSLAEHMRDLDLRPDLVAAGTAYLDPVRIFGFIEIHIEQGPVLEGSGVPVGLVTGIAGSFRYRKAKCLGEWGHSGAVPRAYRKDAVTALSELACAMDAHWRTLEARGERATVTFGQVATHPDLSGFSTVPGEVAFAFDARSLSVACLNELHSLFMSEVERIERERGVRFELGQKTGSTPALLDGGLRKALLDVASGLGIETLEMPSGAGHDTAVFANAGVPATMLFVRNQNGSHNPAEAMRIEDFGLAVQVLAGLLAGP